MESFNRELALRWFKRASEDTEVVDRFIGYWISFRSIYGTRPETKEVEKILQTTETLSMEQAASILNLPEVDYYIELNPSVRYHDSRTGQLKTTEHLQNRIINFRRTDPKVALEALIEMIFKTRPNLFGSNEEIPQISLLSKSLPILHAVLECLLCSQEAA